MRKRKQLPSRKRRTARYCLALAAVVLVSSLTGFYTFTPGRAARDNADRQGIEDARVVLRTQGPELIAGWGSRIYLVEGERAILLCPVNFGLLTGGFHGGISSTAETWDGSGLYIGILQGADAKVSYVFGRVDDPAVTALTLAVTMENGGVWEQTLTPGWLEKNGVRYFAECVEDLPLEENSGITYRVTAVGGEGRTAVIAPACWF